MVALRFYDTIMSAVTCKEAEILRIGSLAARLGAIRVGDVYGGRYQVQDILSLTVGRRICVSSELCIGNTYNCERTVVWIRDSGS